MALDPTPLGPDWWLSRLYKQLIARNELVEKADNWYSGPQPAPRGYERANLMLMRLQAMANLNCCSLVVDAAVERMHVEGFKVSGQINNDAWNIWQSNNLDLGSEMVFTDRMALGEASMLVDPTPNLSGLPTITPEHPLQTIVAYLPGRMSTRAAGLKVWVDDLLSPPMLMATVYLSDLVVTYMAPLQKSESGTPTLPEREPKWERQDSLSGSHDLGEVPLVAFPNRPRMLKAGCPEFDRAIPVQKRINKTLLDRLTMQDFGAFRQKWATGLEVPVDPETNQPIEPFKAAIDRMWIADGDSVQFGQFDADDIQPLLAAVADDVKHFAALVPTPPHYLLGDLVNLSAEALKAAEASLVSRIKAHTRHIEEPLEAVQRLALRAAGQDSPAVGSMQTLWRNPEFRTEGELVDALVKMSTLGVPKEALWERWGATPQEIAAWKSQQRAEMLTQAATNTSNLFGSQQAQPMMGGMDAGRTSGPVNGL